MLPFVYPVPPTIYEFQVFYFSCTLFFLRDESKLGMLSFVCSVSPTKYSEFGCTFSHTLFLLQDKSKLGVFFVLHVSVEKKTPNVSCTVSSRSTAVDNVFCCGYTVSGALIFCLKTFCGEFLLFLHLLSSAYRHMTGDTLNVLQTSRDCTTKRMRCWMFAALSCDRQRFCTPSLICAGLFDKDLSPVVDDRRFILKVVSAVHAPGSICERISSCGCFQ